MNKEFQQWLSEQRFIRYKGWTLCDVRKIATFTWSWEYISKETKYKQRGKI